MRQRLPCGNLSAAAMRPAEVIDVDQGPPGPDASIQSSGSMIGDGTRVALLVGGGLAVALGAILSLTSKTTVTTSSGATFTVTRPRGA
jgi:hypothetical protein